MSKLFSGMQGCFRFLRIGSTEWLRDWIVSSQELLAMTWRGRATIAHLCGRNSPRHCERSDAIQEQRKETGSLPPSLFELPPFALRASAGRSRRTRSSQRAPRNDGKRSHHDDVVPPSSKLRDPLEVVSPKYRFELTILSGVNCGLLATKDCAKIIEAGVIL
jgi:hypothetical protein